jgi:two-component system response regulator CpxR
MVDAAQILIIDDDAELCELLTELLGQEGYSVESAKDGVSGLARALAKPYALVVLDVMLPGQNGFEVLQRLRQTSRVPVLMLTARGEDVDRIVGLEMGADDYLPKPFNPRELVARVRAIHRRARDAMGGGAGAGAGTGGGPSAGGADGKAAVSMDDLELSPAARRVRLRGEELKLTTAEYDLLEVLVGRAGSVVSREELTKLVLGRRLAAFDLSLEAEPSGSRVALDVGAGAGAGAGLALEGSEELLRRAIENVLRNAVRFTEPGSTVSVRVQRAGEGLQRAGEGLQRAREGSARGFAEIRVRDRGPGVPEAALEDIFKPFYRVGDDRARGSGGTGIGLAITRRAVLLHGGEVCAENVNDAEGSGLQVTLRLPIHEGEIASV